MGKNLIDIIFIIIPSFASPLLSNILFELWKEKRNKEWKKRSLAAPLFSISLWGQFDKFRITKFESFAAFLMDKRWLLLLELYANKPNFSSIKLILTSYMPKDIYYSLAEMNKLF